MTASPMFWACRAGRGERGRSLLELLVAMALMMVVAGIALSAYFATGASSRDAAVIARLNEDAMLAHALIGNAVRMAGFSLPRRQVARGGAEVDGQRVVAADRNFTGAAVRGCDFGFANPTISDFDALVCKPGPAGEPAFALRHEAASERDTESVQALLPTPEDCLGQDVVDDVAGALERPYRLVESRYLVRTSATSGSPELFCAGAGNDHSAYPLFQFAEGMSVHYAVAADGTARTIAAPRYLTAAEVDGLPGSVDERWSRVIAMRLCLLMRGSATEGTLRSIYVDCEGRPRAAPDAALRRAYATVIALRNRSGYAAPTP